MRILDVSSWGFSTARASCVADDSDVVVDGATEVTGDSSTEPEEAEAMVEQRRGSPKWWQEEAGLKRCAEMSRWGGSGPLRASMLEEKT